MITPYVTPVGSLPTAHPASGPLLVMHHQDPLMHQRLRRSTTRLVQRQGPLVGAAARLQQRATMAA